jgi:hypothetical protein
MTALNSFKKSLVSVIALSFPMSIVISLTTPSPSKAIVLDSFSDPSSLAGDGLDDIFSTGGGLSITDILSVAGIAGDSFGLKIPGLGSLSSLGGITKAAGIDTGESDLSPENLDLALKSSGLASEFFKGISKGGTNNVLNASIKGGLGILGILDPQAISNTVTLSGIDDVQLPDGGTSIPSTEDAISPQQVSWTYRLGSNQASRARDDTSRIVIGTDGQKLMESQIQESALAMQQQTTSAETTGTLAQSSSDVAVGMSSLSQKAGEKAKECKAAVASKDVLKCNSELLALIATQNSGLSNQNAIRDTSAFQLAAQVLALHSETKAQGDQLRMLQVIAATNLQANNETAFQVTQANDYAHNKDLMEVSNSVQSSNQIFIPGYNSAE